MENNQPLDILNVSSSNDSGLNEANTAAQLDAATAVTGKLTGGKGSKFALPTFSGDSPIDQTVLDNLERMRIEKQAGQGSLANTLLDTLAIFPGDPTLRSQSIGSRLGQRNQEEADIANLATTVASGRVAAEQTAIQKKNIVNFLANEGVGRGAGGVGGAGGYGGNASGLSKDVLNRVSQLVSENKIDSANKLLNHHLIDVGKTNREKFLTKDTHIADIQVSAPTKDDPNATRFVSVDDIASGRYKRESVTAEGEKTLQGKQQEQVPQGELAKTALAMGIPVISAYRPFERQKQLYDEWVTGGKQGNPVAPPGASMHQADMALDVDMSKATSQNIQWLMQNGFKQTMPQKDPNHWELTKVPAAPAAPAAAAPAAAAPAAAAPAAAAPAAAAAPMTTAPATTAVAPPPKISAPAPTAVSAPGPGLAPSQKSAPELAVAGAKGSDEEFRKNTLTPLAERVNTQRNDKLYADMAIDALNKGSYGPGSSIGQMTAQAAQALGLPLSAAEREEYFNKLTIEQVRQNFVASSARAAMGAQFTQVESERFAKTLAGINDPKEYIKTVYQIKKALAEIDEAHVKYIRSHQTNLAQAENKWSQTGEPERIMRSTVDKFKNLPSGGTAEAKPGQKPVKRVSLNDM